MRPAKFTELADTLTAEIKSGAIAPGAPLPSQHTLAGKHSLSRSCVQKVFDLLDSRGLVDRRPGKGFFAKGSAPAKKFETIAFFMSKQQKLTVSADDNYGLEIMWGAEEKASELGLSFLLRRYSETEIHNVERLCLEKKIDGLVLIESVSDRDLELIARAGIPVCAAGRISTVPGVSSSSPNYFDAVRALQSALDACGAVPAEFFYSGVYPSNADFAVLAAARPGGDRFIFTDFAARASGTSGPAEDAALRRSVLRAAESGRRTLVFASDWWAVKAIGWLKEKGCKVPEDIGVVGCLGLALAETCAPGLTTLAVSPRETGARAVDILRRMITENSGPLAERVPMRLVERGSFKLK
jgi:DNA-binding LacI/PurR family transcriptional regulator